MYVKASFRHNPDIKDIVAYYRLIESYRNKFDRVSHKTLLNIGFGADANREQKDKVVYHLNEGVCCTCHLNIQKAPSIFLCC